jgi:hypothetical protein
MKLHMKASLTLSTLLLLGILLLSQTAGFAEDQNQAGTPSLRPHIDLTESFYRALQNESSSGDRSYGTGTSDEYLRQIAISTKFMVETNIQIIKQQEKMIELLSAMSGAKHGR